MSSHLTSPLCLARWAYTSRNQITAIPSSLCRLAALTSLNLSNNKLTALNPDIGLLSQLVELVGYAPRLFIVRH